MSDNKRQKNKKNWSRVRAEDRGLYSSMQKSSYNRQNRKAVNNNQPTLL